MFNLLKNMFGNDNEKELKKLAKTVQQINQLEAATQQLKDEELAAKTRQFKEQLEQGKTLEDILPEAFAVVREASIRTVGMRHFDVQLLGGIILHQGKIAEMKTGEGKTLVATLPAYLNALIGKGVHIITVNDYLARRDSEWMGMIFRFLGLKVGLVVHGLDYDQRKAGYTADITYGTNNEFGFDYLRDNMVLSHNNIVQRPLNYAILDEVDCILVDEARTPLIISGAGEQSTDLYYRFAKVVPRLRVDADYLVDEKAHTVAPTEQGIDKVEKMIGIDHLYDHNNMDLSHYLNQALRAHALMKRDRDYVVKNGEVIIVDEFTGRLMFGRRYSNGLHQAIEAKEGVKIEKESQTLATITFQNYFRMYRKLAGMTGTAVTEAEEFSKIYGLDVVVVPTNVPMIRKDLPDVIYKTENAKFRAVVDEIVERHQTGQPVLVGTISIERSEILSDLLSRRGAPHQVLNAKFHEKEAEIVAQAGRYGMVTIATNMAGRGTDIILGGNPEFLVRERLRGLDFPAETLARAMGKGVETDEEVLAVRVKYAELLEDCKLETAQEHEKVVSLGGLHIIGTERHESRRIDNQLRGRSGRQGDPGSSRFYISLEDDLMRLFGADNIASIMGRLGLEEDQPIEHPLISRAIENAQRRVESRNFDIRKHVLEYDDVMNKQREVIYEQRYRTLAGENLRSNIFEMVAATIDTALGIYANEKVYPEEWDLPGLVEYLENLFVPAGQLTTDALARYSRPELRDYLKETAEELYNAKEAQIGPTTMRDLERLVMLKLVDDKWMEHLDAMDDLREGISLRAYGQKDPLIEYKFEAYEAFQAMIDSIREDVVRYIFRVSVVKPPEQRQTVENRVTDQPAAPVRREQKVGRNDPCPCGSGKKYKKCCGKE